MNRVAMIQDSSHKEQACQVEDVTLLPYEPGAIVINKVDGLLYFCDGEGWKSPGSSVDMHIFVDYSDTQFTVKLKVETGSTVDVHWGDGTTTSVPGQGATEIELVSNYSDPGTYNFEITGEIEAVTSLDLAGQGMCSGALSMIQFATGLTYLDISGTNLYGDIANLDTIPPLQYIYAADSLVVGSVLGLSEKHDLIVADFTNCAGINGDASQINDTALEVLKLSGTGITWTSVRVLTSDGVTIDISNCGLDRISVDKAIESFSTCTNSTFDVAGNNQNRSAATNDDLNTLYTNGNTIVLNDVLGEELHTDLNAANDSVSTHITAFADHGSVIDGATKVTVDGDVTGMLPAEVLGSDLVMNGDFAEGTGNVATGWTQGTGWARVDNGGGAWVAHCDGTQSGNSALSQTALTAYEYYILKYTILNYSAGNIYVRLGSTGYESDVVSADGTHMLMGQTGGTPEKFFLIADADFVGDIDNASVEKLLVTKEIAGSTNYSGDQYVLPVDVNNLAIAVPYVGEAIDGQKIAGEADATAGWEAFLNAIISSVDTPVSVGDFALLSESNTTPTPDARSEYTIDAEIGASYRVEVDARHIGSGGDYKLVVDGVDAFILASTDTNYATKVFYFTASSISPTIEIREINATNNGGMYVDNLSIKKVTFSTSKT